MPSLDDRTVARLRAVVVVLLVSGTGLGVGVGLVLALSLLLVGLGVEPSPLVLLVASLVSIQGIAFGGVAVGYLLVRGWSLPDLGVRIPSVRDLLFVVGGYVTALLAAIAGAVVISATSAPAGENQVTEFASADPSVLLWLIPASFLLIGPGEELLFRGIVQGRLRETFEPVPGVALASAIFAAVHFVALTGGAGGRLVTVTVLFFPALVFGAVYELTDNLVVPALVHGAYNATLFSLAYLAFRLSESGSFPEEPGPGETAALLLDGVAALPA
ncbi:CPBP family intramembrane glutamic endopeptidase [Haloplanus pelagicus]|jgi:membrane protease YdiL (CAAX protease family)|uniref:CPBP family intramembrane glutamic endopeptidase n=1 Tax=Haloplanus pelagicus TaxID=2949995 RepID=UPI00203E49F2|nr:CPBP family intramembrane glutamic endopeptidase [Haloplanus sp. HW8-1]